MITTSIYYKPILHRVIRNKVKTCKSSLSEQLLKRNIKSIFELRKKFQTNQKKSKYTINGMSHAKIRELFPNDVYERLKPQERNRRKFQ